LLAPSTDEERLSPKLTELEEVRKRLADLERRPPVQSKLTVVRDRGSHDGGASGGSSWQEASRLPPTLEEREWAADEWSRQLTELVRSQAGNHAWGRELIGQLRDIVDSENFSGVELLESDCGLTLCRAVVRIDPTDPERFERMKSDLVVSEPFKRPTLRIAKGDGRFELFLAKQGSSIPKRM
jgi:hypothetical protein